MVSGPEQSHNLPPWLQVQRPQSEPHDVHKPATQPAEKQAQRMADHGTGFYKRQGVVSPTKIPWSGTFDRMKNL